MRYFPAGHAIVYNVGEQRTDAAACSIGGATRLCRRVLTSCAAAEEEDDAGSGVGPRLYNAHYFIVARFVYRNYSEGFEGKDNELQLTQAPSMKRSKRNCMKLSWRKPGEQCLLVRYCEGREESYADR